MRTVKKPEERKRELVEIAMKLFFSKGFEKTSVQDIYAEAGGSFGMFYHHFKSKEEIFEAAMDRATDIFIDKLSGVLLNIETDFKLRYKAAMELWAGYLSERDKVSDYKHDVAVFRLLSLKMLSGSVGPIRLYIEEGAKKGLFKISDSSQTAVFMLYGMYGLMREERLLCDSNKNAPSVIKQVNKLFAKILNADENVFDFGGNNL